MTGLLNVPSDVYQLIIKQAVTRHNGRKKVACLLRISRARFEDTAVAVWATIDMWDLQLQHVVKLCQILDVIGFQDIRYGKMVKHLFGPPSFITKRVTSDSATNGSLYGDDLGLLIHFVSLCDNLTKLKYELPARSSLRLTEVMTKRNLQHVVLSRNQYAQPQSRSVAEPSLLLPFLQCGLKSLFLDGFAVGKASPGLVLPGLERFGCRGAPIQPLVSFVPDVATMLRELVITLTTDESQALHDLVALLNHSLIRLDVTFVYKVGAASYPSVFLPTDCNVQHLIIRRMSPDCLRDALPRISQMRRLLTFTIYDSSSHPIKSVHSLFDTAQSAGADCWPSLHTFAWHPAYFVPNDAALFRRPRLYRYGPEQPLFEDIQGGGFFTEERAIAEIRAKLAAQAISFPQDTLEFISTSSNE